MGKLPTLVTLSTMFLLLSEHSQVLTFFGPDFALLCFALCNNLWYYILTWSFGKRNPGVKGFLESLDLNVYRTDFIW